MGPFGVLPATLSGLTFVLLVGFGYIPVPGALAWSKEGHMMTCRIAQAFSTPIERRMGPRLLAL
uniref:Uncharacterized protein n=1 Tax=Nelumbo nucifera TaxID=4432 RepID=A0A822XH70_NELNU|nr:TPA_asm: hypothetical protein HUJ06_022287 [Nelumbo nucifera]